MSCGCAPSSANETSAPRSAAAGGPCTTRPGTSDARRSSASPVTASSWARTCSIPSARSQSTAAPSPIASAIWEVPASNFHGRSVHVDSLAADRADHVTTADERRHLLEQRAAAVQHADPGRAVGLVSGPGVEVGVDRAQVDRHLRDRLGAVDQHDGAHRVRPAHDLGDRVDRAEHVRHVDDGHELGPAGQQLVERVEVELPVLEHGDVGKLGLRGPGRAAATGRCSSGAPSRSAPRGRPGGRSGGPRCRRRG